MEPCARDVGSYRDKVLVSQMAMLQLNQCTWDLFWQGLARHDDSRRKSVGKHVVLSVRETSLTASACLNATNRHEPAG
jgi:hypothetical protein